MKAVFLCIVFMSVGMSAQTTFEITDASKSYNVKLVVDGCDEGFCGKNGVFTITKKADDKLVQVIKMPDIEFLIEEAQLSDTKLKYDTQSVIFFEDYNFDGTADIAVRENNLGGYGSPNYQIFLFNKAKDAFVLSKPLTEIAQDGMGMFEVDPKKKMLLVSTKSGCCWHQDLGYTVVNNVPKKVYEWTRDASFDNGTEGKKVKVTTKTLVKGKWITRVKLEDFEAESN